MIIEQLVTSFIASGAFGIIFNAPKKSILKCAFVGMLGWIIYVVLALKFDMVVATIVASLVIGVTGHVFSKIYKTPVIIFSVAGIIPLVPGGMAYDAMRNFVENDYNAATNLAAKAFMISGSIAIGLIFSEVLNQIFRRSNRQITR
ncbi:threonine/serine exporter family protein [Metabacillus sp. GX 13764]|uniref:threonine/serine exporter family protein n=1 Tax=Metabacillus kandeliae TaxID=2900151 RepID=UPI001E2F602A|nr:threonine/serine exporter family protein [Metabacillus kandeliae]MCD7034011.1 threonine/serine exporter family protein [Metabacillus kandeliae]